MKTSEITSKIVDAMKNGSDSQQHRADYAAVEITSQMDQHVVTALQQAETIRQKMDNLIQALKEDGADTHFNGCGEIQGLGNELDATLAKLASTRKTLEIAIQVGTVYGFSRLPMAVRSGSPATTSIASGLQSPR